MALARTIYKAAGNFVAQAGVTRARLIVDYPNPLQDLAPNGSVNTTGGLSNGGTTSQVIDYIGQLWMWGGASPSIAGGSMIPQGAIAASTAYSSPILITGAPGVKWRQAISVGGAYGGALDTQGGIWMWGNNTIGVLGNGNVVGQSTPTLVLGTTRFAKMIIVAGGAAATASTMGAIDTAGNLWTWGGNLNGQLGISTVLPVSSPTLVVGAKIWASVYSANTSMYGVDTSGAGWAWGANASGNLGTGNQTAVSSPTAIVGSKIWVRIVPAAGAVFGLDTAGAMWAWGATNSGVLGTGATVAAFSSPTAVVGGVAFADMLRGDNIGNNFGGIDTSGNIWLWGPNTHGECGQGSVATAGYSSPVMVAAGGVKFKFVFQNNTSLYAIDVNGNGYAWGQNPTGSGLGIANGVAAYSSPTLIAGNNTWSYFSCNISLGPTIQGIDTNGNIWQWGGNGFGQLGNNTATSSSTPVLVVGQVKVAMVNPPQSVFMFDVVPGTTYPIAVAYGAQFGNNLLGYMPKQVTVEWEQ